MDATSECNRRSSERGSVVQAATGVVPGPKADFCCASPGPGAAPPVQSSLCSRPGHWGQALETRVPVMPYPQAAARLRGLARACSTPTRVCPRWSSRLATRGLAYRIGSRSLAEPLGGAGQRITNELFGALPDWIPRHAVAENLNLRVRQTAIKSTQGRARHLRRYIARGWVPVGCRRFGSPCKRLLGG